MHSYQPRTIAQKGAKDIYDSTKRGLSAKKARGFTLGKPENFTVVSRALGRAVVQRNAQEAVPNKQARRLPSLLRRDGLTLAAIAAEFNAHGYRTRWGKECHKTTVLCLVFHGSASAGSVELDKAAEQ